jgi:hypothetical protein
MKGFIGKLILFVILSIFLYRQRYYLFRIVLGMEALRRLAASLNLRWMDAGEWINHRQDDQSIDHA